MKKGLFMVIVVIAIVLVLVLSYVTFLGQITGRVVTRTDCPDSMVGYWKLDGNSEDELEQYKGVAYDAVWDTGRLGKALKVGDTEGYIDVPSLAGTEFPQERGSLEMWVYSESYGPDTINIFDEWDKSRDHILIRTAKNDYNFQIAFYDIFMDNFNVNYLTNLEKKKWHHIIITWDLVSYKAQIYVDSELKMTEVLPKHWKPEEQNFIIGTKPEIIYKTGSVLIDEVALYDRVLGESEILNHYNLGDGGDYCMGDCHYSWWFDDNTLECKYDKFCGAYMYLGLQEFDTEKECLSALGKTGKEVNGCSYLNNDLIKRASQLELSYEQEIILKEGEKTYKDNYVVVPGYLLKLDYISNSTGLQNDKIEFEDLISKDIYPLQIVSEGLGNLILDETTYDVKYHGTATTPLSSRYVTLDFPQTSGNDWMSFEDCE